MEMFVVGWGVFEPPGTLRSGIFDGDGNEKWYLTACEPPKGAGYVWCPYRGQRRAYLFDMRKHSPDNDLLLQSLGREVEVVDEDDHGFWAIWLTDTATEFPKSPERVVFCANLG